jgi:hypothetical protein
VTIADFILSPCIAALGVWFIWLGVRIWRTPSRLPPVQLQVMGWDRAALLMGLFAAWMAIGVFGQALTGVTRAPAAKWIMVAGGAGMVLSAFLFVSVWYFNRPKFLVPPQLRHLPGTLHSSRRSRGGEHTRR